MAGANRFRTGTRRCFLESAVPRGAAQSVVLPAARRARSVYLRARAVANVARMVSGHRGGKDPVPLQSVWQALPERRLCRALAFQCCALAWIGALCATQRR